MFYCCLKNTLLFFAALIFSCGSGNPSDGKTSSPGVSKKESPEHLIVGANRTKTYLPLLQGKRVAVVGNQTSVIFPDSYYRSEKPTSKDYVHLVDSLLAMGVDITKVFAPEHGFRGQAAAGETVEDKIDIKTGLPIVSLYGDNKKPTPEQLQNVDILIFDIQDVGTRFYTYISTLHYVMEAAAEKGIPIIVLDRPNPNGHYIDGPVLEPEFQSFVGMHPVPAVYGMTIGEYAKMINGEGWLKNNIKADLTVIKMKNYVREEKHHLPIKPSPNLPNDKAINLYPSLCFFEGTNVSAGRGTNMQFQIFGSPYLNPKIYPYTFTPMPNAGSKYPKHQGELCYGKNLEDTPRLSKINLKWLINAYHNTKDRTEFFTAYFNKLAGTDRLKQKIIDGWSTEKIKKSWQEGLAEFKEMRGKYLIYEQ